MSTKKVTIVLQMAVTGIVSYLIAFALKLDYAITAGILAVLSTQLTKKESFSVAVKRSLDTVLGLFLSSLMFIVFGYNVYVFWVFALMFACLSFSFKIEIGIVPVLVLVSHLLEHGSFNWLVLLNEFAIMGIAIVVVLIYDLSVPSPSVKEFKNLIDEIDNEQKNHMDVIVKFLRKEINEEEAKKHYKETVELFNRIYNKAILLDKDLLFKKENEYLAYLEMRKRQMSHINHIYKHSLKLTIHHEYLNMIVNFIDELILDIGYDDKATSQMEKLFEVRKFYKGTKLPKTRDEFETRAMLYQILNELEYFLDVKIKFHQRNPGFGF